MLQNVIIQQILCAIFSIGLLILGIKFWKKSTNKFTFIAMLLFIICALGNLYFLYISYMQWTLIASSITNLVILTLEFEMILYMTNNIKDGFNQTIGIASIFGILFVVIILMDFITDISYDRNKIVPANKQIYIEETYELLDKFSEKNSINTYFNVEEYTNSETKEKKKRYQIYYLDDSDEIIYYEISQDVKFIPLKDGEKPYIYIKKYFNYDLDYNKKPPEKCNLQLENLIHEIHTYEEDIEKIKKEQ